METTAGCFQRVGKMCCDKPRLKIDLRTGFRISKQPFVVKAEIQSNSRNFDDDDDDDESHSRQVYDLE